MQITFLGFLEELAFELDLVGHAVFPGGSDGQVSACNARDLVRKIPLEKDLAAHSSILAWRIPWTEELGGLQSMGSHRVGHD